MAKTPRSDDVTFIQSLAELLQSHELHEIEVKREYDENDRLNVRVTRSAPHAAVSYQQAVPMASAPSAAAPLAAPAPAAPPPPAAASVEDLAAHPGAVTSPMVGTAYMQAEPGTPAFVSVGDQVSEGQTIMIIEAMKTMNQIPAPKSGRISRIVVEDGSPVEFGTLLMVIE